MDKRLDLVRSTGLKQLRRSPAHYRAWTQEPDKDSPQMALGRALHCAVLEPDRFARDYVVEPDFGDCRFKEAKAARDAWRAENASRTPVAADDYSAIIGMQGSLRAHPVIAKLFADVRFTEQRVEAAEPRWPSLTSQATFDLIVPSKGIILDLKTTDDAAGRACERSVGNFGYALQAAHYMAVAELTGVPIKAFLFAFVERDPPYACNLVMLDGDVMQWAHNERDRLLALQAECLASGNWPAYDEHIHIITLPKWAREES